jgi:hypothetical protein
MKDLAPDGQLFLLTSLYKDLPDWNSTVAGWRDIHTEELLKRSDSENNINRHDRALLISAQK